MDQAKIMTTDTSAEAEMDCTNEATTRDNCPRDSCMRERMLLLEQRCQNLQKENNKMVKLIKVEQKKRKKAEAQITNAESLELTNEDKQYFNLLEKETEEQERESET